MRYSVLLFALLLFAPAPQALCQDKDRTDIDQLFHALKLALIQRSSPERFLSPSLPASRRGREAEKAVRPYVTLEFKYNLADLRSEGSDRAALPLIVEWETAKASGRMTDTAELEKVDGQWFFRNYGFLSFPWGMVVGGCLIGVAFATTVLYFFVRSRRRTRAAVIAQG